MGACEKKCSCTSGPRDSDTVKARARKASISVWLKSSQLPWRHTINYQSSPPSFNHDQLSIINYFLIINYQLSINHQFIIIHYELSIHHNPHVPSTLRPRANVFTWIPARMHQWRMPLDFPALAIRHLVLKTGLWYEFMICARNETSFPDTSSWYAQAMICLRIFWSVRFHVQLRLSQRFCVKHKSGSFSSPPPQKVMTKRFTHAKSTFAKS